MRVIVRLILWEPFRPEGELTEGAVIRQRTLISGAQQGLAQALTGYLYTVTMQSLTTPFIGLEVPAATLARLEALVGVVIESVTVDEVSRTASLFLGPPLPVDPTAMLPVGYAYDPVASDVVAMQQLALDAGTPPVLIGVEDPVVGDWGPSGGSADAFLVVTATTPPATDIVTGGAEPSPPAPELVTLSPVAAEIAPSPWGMGTWLLIIGAAWLLLRK